MLLHVLTAKQVDQIQQKYKLIQNVAIFFLKTIASTAMYTLSTISLLSNCPPPPWSPPPPCPPSGRSVHPGRLRPTEWCHKGQVHFVRPTPTATYDSRALTNYYQLWREAQVVDTSLHNWQLWLPSLTYFFYWISSTSFKSWTAPKRRLSMQSANFDQRKISTIWRYLSMCFKVAVCSRFLIYIRDFVLTSVKG